jgi:hypothetical protein
MTFSRSVTYPTMTTWFTCTPLLPLTAVLDACVSARRRWCQALGEPCPWRNSHWSRKKKKAYIKKLKLKHKRHSEAASESGERSLSLLPLILVLAVLIATILKLACPL